MVELCPFVPGESNLKFYIIEYAGTQKKWFNVVLEVVRVHFLGCM
jgi:hypothetical protein